MPETENSVSAIAKWLKEQMIEAKRRLEAGASDHGMDDDQHALFEAISDFQAGVDAFDDVPEDEKTSA